MPNRTPLYQSHVDLGAQMVDFGGWIMPVRYTSDKEEHFATRKNAGLFDVSHMGEVFLRGPRAVDAADYLLTNNIQRLKINQAAYSMMLKENGGIVDDVIAYKMSNEEVLICINAGNRNKDVNWIQKTITSKFNSNEVTVTNESTDWAQIALQGPSAQSIFNKIMDGNLWPVKKFWFTCHPAALIKSGAGFDGGPPHPDKTPDRVRGDIIVARTGYTGEDGVEIFLPTNDAKDMWDKLLVAGAEHGIKPCGLSARDSLRLEAGLCLYGNDINEVLTPVDANLMWTVKLKGDDFVGKESIIQKKDSPTKKLVGLKITGRGIARHDYPVQDSDGENIGIVTSGTQSPTLGFPIAMAYVNAPHFETGNVVYVNIRNRPVTAEIVDIPFVPRG